MDLQKIKAIDIHVHAEMSCRQPPDPIMEPISFNDS